jgi:hypothetical protein
LEEAETILAKRVEEGFLGQQPVHVKEFGVFYLIQLVPELDSRRIKLGFADDITSRLSQHQTAAPTAKLVKTWACKRTWEHTVIDCLSINCSLILNEVYECEDIPLLIEKADQLFNLLPGTGQKIELSEYSPYKTSTNDVRN